ncbi:MAG: hypothetical protein KDC98_22320, partial [Planctomycetes bacterium]|nr:hypothetical protein [Planctomycetota bacterium]
MSVRMIVTLSLLVFAGCSSVGVEGVEFGGPPSAHRRFPALSPEGIVYGQARYADHVADLGVDLIEVARVVPVNLMVRLHRAGGAELHMVDPSRMHLRMILSDGSVMESVGVDQVVADLDEEIAAKVRARSFRGGLLEEQPKEGYVFFGITPPTKFEMSGS